jgi:hypothetical protein
MCATLKKKKSATNTATEIKLDYWVSGLCPLSGILKNTVFKTLCVFSDDGQSSKTQ